MKHYKITPPNIIKLEQNEVFLIGTNSTGFHGAGAAGYAFRFDSSGNWRTDEFFLKAMNSTNFEDKIGKWSIYGQAKGFMQGKEGASYGIITIKKPGQRRSWPLTTIQYDTEQFLEYARNHPQLHFFVTEIGCNMAGYKIEEIAPMFKNADKLSNVSIPQSFADYLNTL